jgi:hypothetical protein
MLGCPFKNKGFWAAHKGYSSIGSQAARLARGLKLSGKRDLPGGVLQVPPAVSALGAVDCLYKAHGLTEGRRPERVMLLVPRSRLRPLVRGFRPRWGGVWG